MGAAQTILQSARCAISKLKAISPTQLKTRFLTSPRRSPLVHPLRLLAYGVDGVLEPPPAAEPRFGRRTALTFPLFPPPQKS